MFLQLVWRAKAGVYQFPVCEPLAASTCQPHCTTYWWIQLVPRAVVRWR